MTERLLRAALEELVAEFDRENAELSELTNGSTYWPDTAGITMAREALRLTAPSFTTIYRDGGHFAPVTESTAARYVSRASAR